jgi:two-component system chemotaxis response regulator CheB
MTPRHGGTPGNAGDGSRSCPARLLIVDHSAFVRRTLRNAAEGTPDIVVAGEAGDRREALEKAAALHPDVVTLDLRTPGEDGLATLCEMRKTWPDLPVLVLDAAGPAGGSLVFEALSLGAFDFIDTSRWSPMDLHLLGPELVAKVRAAWRSRHGAPLRQADEGTRREAADLPSEARIVCVGASTGGPRALQLLIEALPASFPIPVAIVQHMPVGFTAPFAERLNRCTPLEVREAREADEVRPGRILLAPAGRHVLFSSGPRGERARLSVEPADAAHIPSVDVLFASAAETYGASAIGIVLTGMGSDGCKGARRLAENGAFLIAESEATCVVYGMPKALVKAGLARAVWPLQEIARRLAAVR